MRKALCSCQTDSLRQKDHPVLIVDYQPNSKLSGIETNVSLHPNCNRRAGLDLRRQLGKVARVLRVERHSFAFLSAVVNVTLDESFFRRGMTPQLQEGYQQGAAQFCLSFLSKNDSVILPSQVYAAQDRHHHYIAVHCVHEPTPP